MKEFIASLFAVLLFSGCATVPSNPEPHETKYAIQVLEVNSATPFNQKLMQDPDGIDTILKNPNTKVYEYPTLYAGIGETVADDQTKSVPMPEDYEVIDGKAVPKEKPVRLGKAVEISVSSIERGRISYNIDIYDKELKGYESYKTKEGIEFKMPYFTFRGLNTELTHSMNEWVGLGHLADKKGTIHFFCVRVLPPKQSK